MPLWPCCLNVRLVPSSLGLSADELALDVAEFVGPRLSVQLVEQRLGIEGLQVTGTAGHEQEDYRFGLPGLWPCRPGAASLLRAWPRTPGCRIRKRRRSETRGGCG